MLRIDEKQFLRYFFEKELIYKFLIYKCLIL